MRSNTEPRIKRFTRCSDFKRMSNHSARPLGNRERNGSHFHAASLLIFPSLSPYEETHKIQSQLCLDRIARTCSDTLVLVEHKPVVTLGRTTKGQHWQGMNEHFKRQGIPVIECERGGSVTYHGPGQVVGYPILLLRDFCSGPKAYMWLLEEVLIRVLAEWGIEGKRVDKFVGVWVRDPKNSTGNLAKIAAMGVKITRGVTMHGFALNVTVDLEPFEWIVPCGIEGCRVTSMAEVLETGPDLETVREQIVHHFADVFGIEWTERLTEVPPYLSL